MTAPRGTQDDSSNATASLRLTVLSIGSAFALAMGLCDVLFGILSSQPEAFRSFPSILPPVAVTTATSLVLYVLIWLPVGAIGRRRGWRPIPLAFSVAVFCIVIFATATVSDLTNLPPEVHAAWVSTKLTMSLGMGVFAAVAFYRLIPAAMDLKRLLRATRVAGLMVLFLLSLLTTYVWLRFYRTQTAMGGNMLFVGFAFLVLACVWLAMRFGHKARPASFLAVAAVPLVLAPLVIWNPPNRAGASTSGASGARRDIRRVILLSIDTLRADMLSCYNPDGVPTPNLDRIARDAVVFNRAVAPSSWTLPSFASIMTGLAPPVHRATKQSAHMPAILPTLAEHLKEAGYVTGAVGLNHFLLPASNVSKGFDEYRFYPVPSLGSTLAGRILTRLAPDTYRRIPSSPDLTRLACEWVAGHAHKDFFFWLHYLDPHSPYTPPAERLPDGEAPPRIGHAFTGTKDARGGYLVPSMEERDWIRRLYEAEVRHVDDCVGRFLALLDELGLYQDALIVVLSDHGEEFWEHGGVDHGHALYEELIHVPMMIKLPRGHTSSTRVNERVCTGSVMPTILDLCDIEYEPEYLSYCSLLPLLTGRPDRYRPSPILCAGNLFFHDQQAVIFDGMKYIRSNITGHEQLFDLRRDPTEQTSIAASASGELDRMRAVARQLDDSVRSLREHFKLAATEDTDSTMSREMLRDLRSLGYVR
ncbi:MAG TPA: sulfatase-like hydrolase/transferase [Phycisphaerae bacterium]|nr:sulfatase-like hydrolase/transferase [Phycisphaerae bacterium]